MTTTGAALRAAREALGLTQKEMAGRLCCSPQYLNDVESDRRRIAPERVEVFARRYGMDVARLFTSVVPLPEGYCLVRSEAANDALL